LINAGERAFEEYPLAEKLFLEPLRSRLELSSDSFIFIPGNHEIDRKQVSRELESGFEDLIKDEKSFAEFYQAAVPSYPSFDTLARKLDAFMKFRDKDASAHRTFSSFFYDSYMIPIGNLKVGIAAINSSWRCSQHGDDAGRLVIGEKVMHEAAHRLLDADVKILLSHHPFQFLAPWDVKPVGQRAVKDFHLHLNGHVHDSDVLFGHYLPGQLFTSTAGCLRPKELFSSYTVIDADVVQNRIFCRFRKWYREREAFDQDLSKCQGGCKEFPGLKSTSAVTGLAMTVSRTRVAMLANSDEMDVVSPEGIEQLQLQEVFIKPFITDSSQYDNAESEPNPLELDSLISSPSNMLFVGRPEYGKTTLLLYIRDYMLRHEREFGDKVPVYLRFDQIPKTNIQHLDRFVARSLPQFSEKEIASLSQKGSFVFLIDDVNDRQDPDREKKGQVLREFVKGHEACRFLVTTTELVSRPMTLELLTLASDFRANLCHIASLNTVRIRELLTRWHKHGSFDLEQMLKQILYYFQHCQIPVTPLSVTLFFGVLFRKKKEKNIRNEAYLIENYLETILEKVDARNHGGLDFRDKEDFLAHIALLMAQQGKFRWTINEFERAKLDYFDTLNEDVPETFVFETFFKRGILFKDDGYVQYKRRFWFHFFLAKALEKQPESVAQLLARPDVLRFSKALGYKAGLTRNDLSLLKWVNDHLMMESNELRNEFASAELRDREDGMIYKISGAIKDEIQAKNDSKHVDSSRDKLYLSYTEDTGAMDEEEINRLQELLTLQSDVIRNTTQISGSEKLTFISNNVECYVSLMWATLAALKEIFQKSSEEDLLKMFFRGRTDATTREKLRKVVEMSQRIVHHAVPVSIILFMVDHLGTPKLARSFITLGSESGSPTRKLFYGLLLFSQDPAKGFSVVNQIVSRDSSTSEDFVIMHFLRFYCHEHVVTTALLDKVVGLIARIQLKYAKTRPKDSPYLKAGAHISDIRKDLQKHTK